jgi:MATE family multidrug resistance protein
MSVSMSEPKAQGAASLRALLSLAWPVVLARATQSVIGFCDALMVAPLGEEPLAAATTGALNTFAFIILPMGTVFIVQSFVAQLRGRGDLGAIPRYAFYGLGLAVVAGLLVLPFVPFLDDVLLRLGYTPRVTELMSGYIAIRLLSVPGAVGMEALGNWYGGLGNTRAAMIAGVVAMIANIFGNWLLIMPRLGMPGLGVAGAAWASTLSTYVGFLVLLVMFLREREGGKSPAAAFRELHLAEFGRVLRFGFPNGVNWFLEFSAFAVFINLVVGHLGTTVLAAFNVVIQINSISFMPAFGLASAGAIMVGEAIGRRAHDEVWPLVRLTAGVAAAWMGSIALVYVFFASLLMNLFRPEGIAGSELVAVGTTMLALSAIWQLFDAVGLTFSEALRAAGDTAWCMGARIVLAWVIWSPAAFVAVRYMNGGVLTIIASMVLYIALLGATLALRFWSGRWRDIDLVGAEPALV